MGKHGLDDLHDERARLIEREARLRAERVRRDARASIIERRRETRRKILLGAFVLKAMRENPQYAEQVTKQIDKYLTKEGDRQLFGLDGGEPFI